MNRDVCHRYLIPRNGDGWVNTEEKMMMGILFLFISLYLMFKITGVLFSIMGGLLTFILTLLFGAIAGVLIMGLFGLGMLVLPVLLVGGILSLIFRIARM